MTATSTTIPTPAATAARSTRPAAPPRSAAPLAMPGDLVMVRLDQEIQRPLQITSAEIVLVGRSTPSSEPPRKEWRVSGVLFCEPDDHSTPAFRSLGTQDDPARIHGRPDRHLPIAYGEYLAYGSGIGQWLPREVS